MIDQDIQIKIDVSTELLRKAQAFYEYSNYDESERCANEALALLAPQVEREDLGEELDKSSQKYKIIWRMSWAYNRLNVISLARADYALALSQAEIAILFSERIGNLARKADLLSNIGTVQYELTDYPLALEYFGKALVLSEELGNIAGIANIFGNIGLLHFKLTDYQLALEYYGKALAIDDELGNKVGVARHLGNIGCVHLKLTDYPLALEYHKKALALDEELGNKAGVAIHLGNIGEIYAKPEFDGNDVAKAEEFLLKALAMNEVLGMKGMNVDVLKNLSALYATSERWKESREQFVKYHHLKEVVQSDEAKKQANLMEQRKQAAEHEKTLAIERAEATATRNVLNLILPESIATRMIAGEKRIADYYQNISILFADIVGFTALATEVKPDVVVDLLNYVFDAFDEIIKRNGCEKIKTIGDGYMAVAGAPIECTDHAERIARAALEMQQDIHLPDEIRKHLPKETIFNIRVGIHSGAAVCGVIGRERFVWDVYSDAVNTASRMESHGEPGKIHCTEEFMRALSLSSPTSPKSPLFTERGEMEIKGKGKMKTYFLERI